MNTRLKFITVVSYDQPTTTTITHVIIHVSEGTESVIVWSS